MDFLSGKKSYISAISMVLVAGLHITGFIDDTVYQSLMGILVGAGVASLRAAVKSEE